MTLRLSPSLLPTPAASFSRVERKIISGCTKMVTAYLVKKIKIKKKAAV